MEFKVALKEHFKKFEASPMLFIGSGMSKRYLGTENWEQLLLRFCNEIGENPLKLRTSSGGDPTKYAQLLAKSYEDKWWERPESAEISRQFGEHFINDSSILKIQISRYLQTAHKNINSENSSELEILKKANIDGIITTNWDCLLEEAFPNFTTFIGQDGLIAGRSHGIAEIYKIHGCSTHPNSLVLTESDYAEYRRKNPYLSSKLLTIFIERPVIFLGYSLADPHIAEILEDIIGCFPEKSLEFLRDKLIFVEWHRELDEPSITDSVIHKRIPVKLVRANSFTELFEVLAETKKRIPAHIFRRIKDQLYELVITDDPKGQLYVRNERDLEQGDSLTEFVVGYGAISTLKKGEAISKQGLIGLERSDLVRDIIFETEKYDAADVVATVFPKLAKGNQSLPIFHYLQRAGYILTDGELNQTSPPLCAGAVVRFQANLFDVVNAGELRRSKTVPEVLIGVNELYQKQGFELFLRMVPYMEPSLIKSGLEDLCEILRKHVDTSPKNSGFFKLVCFYDLVKNSNRY
ncbi:SIR2 family protein [Pseudomonas syringae]|uniref:SIR2 family protein n=1 Tax=Pseudomonas syringae TaxID=317 RepID=UPI0018E5B6EC|nr:SIR2 family protein [Pseudomonas syringae]MBI6798635.1 SIR2 family protein [Pseudomonas syringae]